MAFRLLRCQRDTSERPVGTAMFCAAKEESAVASKDAVARTFVRLSRERRGLSLLPCRHINLLMHMFAVSTPACGYGRMVKELTSASAISKSVAKRIFPTAVCMFLCLSVLVFFPPVRDRQPMHVGEVLERLLAFLAADCPLQKFHALPWSRRPGGGCRSMPSRPRHSSFCAGLRSPL